MEKLIKLMPYKMHFQVVLISYFIFLVPLLVITLIIKKTPAIPALLLGAVWEGCMGTIFQQYCSKLLMTLLFLIGITLKIRISQLLKQ